jgi:hypothetical protein
MRPSFLIITVVVVLLILSVPKAEPVQPKRSHTVVHPDGSAVAIELQRKMGDIFDWQNSTPLDFLKYLKKQYKASPIYTVVGFHKNWIREEDVPALIKLFDSKEKCASVVLAHSSSKPPKSTVGQEAARMVYSFFSGMYPFGLYPQPVDKRILIKRWEEYSINN